MFDDIHFLKMRCQADVWYSPKELGQMLEPQTTGHHAAYVAKKSGLFLQRRNKGNNGCEYQIAKARFSPIKEAADTIEAQATCIEALEAALRDAAKAERDRLRNLPDDAVFDAWYKLREERFMTIPEGDIRFIATAIADALESKP